MVKEIQTHATPATIFFLNCENASAWPDGFRSSEPTFLFPEELLYRHNSRRKPSMKTVLKNITWHLTSSLPNECLHKQTLGWVSKANLAHCTPPRISQGFASDSRRNSQSSELHQNYRRKKNTLTWRKKNQWVTLVLPQHWSIFSAICTVRSILEVKIRFKSPTLMEELSAWNSSNRHNFLLNSSQGSPLVLLVQRTYKLFHNPLRRRKGNTLISSMKTGGRERMKSFRAEECYLQAPS